MERKSAAPSFRLPYISNLLLTIREKLQIILSFHGKCFFILCIRNLCSYACALHISKNFINIDKLYKVCYYHRMHPPELLRAILDQSQLTQSELAARLGVSHPTLSSWLHGKSQPRATARQSMQFLAFELLGIGEVTSELARHTITQAKSCHLSVESLLASPALLDALTVQMTYHTNSIEGSTMTLADNQKVLLEQKTLRNRSAREQLEARNHQAALLWLLDSIAGGTFCYSTQTARDLHVRLMNGLVSDAGDYRHHGVRILGSRVTVTNYLRIDEKMADLFSRTPPTSFEDLAAFHADFEQIHPFSDGNGRAGRLLLLGLSLAQGLTPPIIRRESRQAYYRYLEQAQMHDNLLPLTYLLAREAISAHQTLDI